MRVEMKENCPDIRTAWKRSFDKREEKRIDRGGGDLRSVNVSEVFYNRQKKPQLAGLSRRGSLKLRMWPDGVSEKSGTIHSEAGMQTM